MGCEAALLAALAPQARENPYAALADLRSLAPVYRHDALDTSFLTRFADCHAVLANPGFIVPDRAWLLRERPEWLGRPAADFFYSSLLGTNAGDHERLRRPLSGAFGARQVAALTAAVGRTVEELLDRFADAACDGGAADFQALVGYPLPIAVMGELIGVPRGQQEQFRLLGQDVACLLEPVRSEADWERADQGVTALREYFAELLRERRARPGDDLLSNLLAHADSADPGPTGRPLADRELADLLLLLFVAGFETTAGLLGLSVFALLTHPDQLALLRADPALLPGAVEESLRWDGPVLMTERLASAPTGIGGVAVPAGASVTVVLGAGNRDPQRYPSPEAFQVRRPVGRGLSFGAGAHYCLGAALARLEAAALLRRLLDRFPALVLAGQPVRRASACLRSFDALPLATTA